jgi:hypothetical protein
LSTLISYILDREGDDYRPLVSPVGSTWMLAVRAAWPDGGFTVDRENDSASSTAIALQHIALADPTIEISGMEQYPATQLISGTVTL